MSKADEKRREDLFQEQLKQAKATEEEQQRRQDLYERQLKQAEYVDTEEQWRKELHIASLKIEESSSSYRKTRQVNLKKKEREMKERDGSYDELIESKTGKMRKIQSASLIDSRN